MNDLNHFVGGDLSLSPAGGLSAVDGIDRGKQRVLRRLITNPGDYIFDTTYGAGLGRYVGALMNVPEIIANIRSQILLEDCVAKTPKPVISVTPSNETLGVSISYTDAPLGEPVTLSFEVSR